MTTEVDYLEKPVDIKVLLEKIKNLTPEKLPLVLVAEDDDLSRGLLVQAILRNGWKSTEASNGKEVITLLTAMKPDVILLDLMMPEMDGFQVIEEIQKHEKWRHIPIIVITAKDLTHDEKTLLNKYSKSLFLKSDYSPRNLIQSVIERIKKENNS
ncbi:MAG TPA: response regulator [Gammaproteobacteria bacterium]|nr:response regulator [Gammaproteobacteria bacterium]